MGSALALRGVGHGGQVTADGATRTRKMRSIGCSREHHDSGPRLAVGGARALSRWG